VFSSSSCFPGSGTKAKGKKAKKGRKAAPQRKGKSKDLEDEFEDLEEGDAVRSLRLLSLQTRCL
jgi:hypothetical protein